MKETHYEKAKPLKDGYVSVEEFEHEVSLKNQAYLFIDYHNLNRLFKRFCQVKGPEDSKMMR